MAYNDLAKALLSLAQMAAPLRMVGKLGNLLTGRVKVSNDDERFYWCRVGDGAEAEQVVNTAGLPPIFNAVVILEKARHDQRYWEIARAGIDSVVGQGSSSDLYRIKAHGPSHASDGADPVAIDRRNLRYPFGFLQPDPAAGGAPTTRVYVMPFTYSYAGAIYTTLPTVIDLAAYIPAAGLIAPVTFYVLVGSVTVQTAAGTAFNPLLTPTPPPGKPPGSALIGRAFVSSSAASTGVSVFEALQELVTLTVETDMLLVDSEGNPLSDSDGSLLWS